MYWKKYVPVAKRREQALKKANKLKKKGAKLQPLTIEGRTIARSFWGKSWCKHLEKFSDYSNRLPRGRTYANNGSVIHLEILKGIIVAIVSGSSLYEIKIEIAPLNKAKWKKIKKQCAGQISSILELLKGSFSDSIMEIVTDRKNGLFPSPDEIKLDCNCPDWAIMCKHVAAAMYGVGNRLDTQPELLFTLRGVDYNELISIKPDISDVSNTNSQKIDTDELNDIFGIDLDIEPKPPTNPKTVKPKRKKTVSSKTKTTKPFTPSGKAIAKVRKKLNLTPNQLADKLKVSESSIRRWESTIGKPKLQTRLLKRLRELMENE